MAAAANPLFAAGVAAVAIIGIVQAVSSLNNSFGDQVEKVEKLTDEYNTLQSEVGGIETELKNVRDSIYEINAQDSISLADEK